MAQHGCNLILHSRSLEHTAKVLEEVKALGVEAYDIAAELSEPAQVQKMIDEINARGKPVDILFNDAAVQIAYRVEYYKTPVEDYAKSFYINTIAPNDPDSVIPGICVGAFIDDKISGRNLGAQAFTGMTLEAALEKAKGFPKLFL